MLSDVNYSLICAVREGKLERARQLISSFGLSYSPAWSEGYVLLCDAIRNNHAAVAKLLLESGSKVNSKNEKPTNSPLHFAAINGDIEVVEMILDKGANVDAKNQDGRTPLHNAIQKKKMEVTELLLKHGAYVNASDNYDTSPLHIAAEKGCLQIVDCLLNYGAYVNGVCTSTSKKSYAPLHLAVEKGSKEVVMLLLSRGANVDIKGKNRLTPLHIATMKGYTHIAEDLLNHGACIHSLTLKEGYMPLHFASELGNGAAVKLFLDRNADINASAKGNETPLHIATKRGHTVVELLLQYGAKVDNQDKDGKTILHLAVEKGDLMIVKAVLKYYPDINNQSNRSSLKIAVQGYQKVYEKIVEALLEYGFNVSPEDANNPELLHRAVEKGNLKIVEDLLKYGANVNAQDKSGNTPIVYAIENSNLKITKLLLASGVNVKDSPELLNIAAEKECIDIVELLLQRDADINASDKFGRTALHFTAEGVTTKGPVKGEIAKLLLNKGVNVNAKQKDGLTALLIAAECGHKEFVKILLECGADIDSRDENGLTALHIACQEGHLEVVVTLLEHGSDVNITSRNNFTPLEYRLDYCDHDSDYDILDGGSCSCETIGEVLERHIVKLKCATLYVSEKILQSISSSYKMRCFQDECEKEIASMKCEKINNPCISFYDILTKDTSTLSIYMRNENIVQVLKSDDHKTKFPIYATMLECNFRKGMERKELLEQGNKIFLFLFNNFPELPYDCTEKILSYLSGKDLRMLIDAGKPLSISNHNIND